MPGCDDAHAHDLVALAGEADADDAGGVAAHRARTSRSWKRAMRPWAVASTMSSLPDETATQASASSSATVMARMPVERTRSNCSIGRLLDDALDGGHDEVVALLEVGQRDDGEHALAGLDLDALEVDDGHALGLAARRRARRGPWS